MAKVLIDLGTEGQPQSGDTLPEGGAKINQHIEDVYAAFSPKIQPDVDKTLHASGVYQSISYDDAPLNEETGFREYTAKPGEMICIDMDASVSIFLPSGVYPGCHIKIFRPASVSSSPIRVYAADGMVQNQEYVEIVGGIQYQFISSLDFGSDGIWSQRIIDGSGNNFNPGPIIITKGADLRDPQPNKLTGTPVWYNCTIDISELTAATSQQFSLMMVPRASVIHMCRIDSVWGSSIEPIIWSMKTNFDYEVPDTILSGADLLGPMNNLIVPMIIDTNSDQSINFYMETASGNLNDAVIGSMTININILLSTTIPPMNLG